MASFSLIRTRDERPEDWVPAESPPDRNGNRTHDNYSESEMHEVGNRNIADIFSIHSGNTRNPLLCMKFGFLFVIIYSFLSCSIFFDISYGVSLTRRLLVMTRIDR